MGISVLTRRPAALTAAGLLGLSALAGCGGDDRADPAVNRVADAEPADALAAARTAMLDLDDVTFRGTVTLQARLESRPGGDWLELAVQDTGVGISPEEMTRLFKDFGQASASTAGAYGGTGLGLAVSQRLCALMGGGISVESQPGRGSCFSVRLPADVTAGEAWAPAA